MKSAATKALRLYSILFALLLLTLTTVAFSAPNPLDVIVNPPGTVTGRGQLEVVGKVGMNQTMTYKLFRCTTDTNAQIVRGGCMFQIEASVGDRVTLSPGLYRIAYSQMLAEAKISDGQVTTLTLQKISVPQTAGNRVQFSVFWDLTNQATLSRYARTTWESYNYANQSNQICSGRYDRIPGGYYFCEAWLSNDPVRFEQTVFNSDAQGNLIALAFMQPPPQFQRRNFGRVMVSDPTDGDFVAVLPGVYGIHFESLDGRRDDIYNILVK